jgi:hypothetical protein
MPLAYGSPSPLVREGQGEGAVGAYYDTLPLSVRAPFDSRSERAA